MQPGNLITEPGSVSSPPTCARPASSTDWLALRALFPTTGPALRQLQQFSSTINLERGEKSLFPPSPQPRSYRVGSARQRLIGPGTPTANSNIGCTDGQPPYRFHPPLTHQQGRAWSKSTSTSTGSSIPRSHACQTDLPTPASIDLLSCLSRTHRPAQLHHFNWQRFCTATAFCLRGPSPGKSAVVSTVPTAALSTWKRGDDHGRLLIRVPGPSARPFCRVPAR